MRRYAPPADRRSRLGPGRTHAETQVRWHGEFAKILAGLPFDEDGGRPASALPQARTGGTGNSHGDH
jgi:hypothetical protein